MLSFLLACASAPAPAPVVELPPAPEDPAIVAPLAPDEPGKRTNLPPRVLALRLTPKDPSFNDSITLSVEAEDPEGALLNCDKVWSVNGGEDVTQRADTYRSDTLKRGDVVRVSVTCRDDEHTSEAVASEVTIRGRPPIMRTRPSQLSRLNGLRMQADDPDGGDIVWSLSGAPAGMIIDPDGTLHYQGSETEVGGDYVVNIIATDPDGDLARMELPMTISPGSAAKKAE